MVNKNNMSNKFIVAEVSKNWEFGDTGNIELLSQRFEKVINFNLERGYKLVDWKTHVCVVSNLSINETIIAIFEKIGA